MHSCINTYTERAYSHKYTGRACIHALKPHNYTRRACIHALIIQHEHTVINIQSGHAFMHSSLIIIHGEHAFKPHNYRGRACIHALILYRTSMHSCINTYTGRACIHVCQPHCYTVTACIHALKPHNYTGRACIHSYKGRA